MVRSLQLRTGSHLGELGSKPAIRDLFVTLHLRRQEPLSELARRCAREQFLKHITLWVYLRLVANSSGLQHSVVSRTSS